MAKGSRNKTARRRSTAQRTHPVAHPHNPADFLDSKCGAKSHGQVVSGTLANTVKLWDPETGACLATFTADASIWCCAVGAGGVTVAAGDSAGCFHFLRL